MVCQVLLNECWLNITHSDLCLQLSFLTAHVQSAAPASYASTSSIHVNTAWVLSLLIPLVACNSCTLFQLQSSSSIITTCSCTIPSFHDILTWHSLVVHFECDIYMHMLHMQPQPLLCSLNDITDQNMNRSTDNSHMSHTLRVLPCLGQNGLPCVSLPHRSQRCRWMTRTRKSEPPTHMTCQVIRYPAGVTTEGERIHWCQDEKVQLNLLRVSLKAHHHKAGH